MKTYELNNSPEADKLVEAVYRSSEPLAVSKDGEECLVVMTPDAFERILFENSQLIQHDRASLRI